MAIIGYIRVSTDKQTCQHQKYEIQKWTKSNKTKISKWVEETVSSRQTLEKRKLSTVLSSLQKDDILIATEISRLGRSIFEVLKILEMCLNKDCQVWTIKENYRLGNDISSKVMAFTFGVAAEIERSLISKRTKASLETLKANGKKLGRPLSSQAKKLKLKKNKEQILKLLQQGVSKSKIAKEMNVERTTLRRFIERNNWSEFIKKRG